MTAESEGWKKWTFGEDLKLERTEPSIPKGPTRRERSLTEEGLETLLMLNLDELFPNLSLRLGRKELLEFSGCDIDAVDPTGRRHIFELKHEASARDVVDQALAYGFQGLNDREFQWFDEQTNNELVAAARAAGFWNGERVQNYSISDDKKSWSPERRIKATIEEVASDARSVDYWTEIGDEHCSQLEPSPEWRRNVDAPAFDLSGVHLHIVVPYAESIKDYALESLGRLVDRGLYATVWEAAVELDSDTSGSGDDGSTRNGRLWLRPHNVPGEEKSADDPGSESWALSSEQLVCQMALQDSGLDVIRADWDHNPTANFSQTLAWPRTNHRQTLAFKLDVNGSEVTCQVGTSKRKWLWDHSDHDQKMNFRSRIRERRAYLAEWLTAVLELENFKDSSSEPVDWFTVSSSERWAPKPAVESSHRGWAETRRHGFPVHAKHAEGMFRTRFTLDIDEHDLDAVADICTDALTKFHEIATTAKYDTEAFGPFEVENPTN